MPKIDIKANVAGLSQLKDLSGVTKKITDTGKDYLKQIKEQVNYYKNLEVNLGKVNAWLKKNNAEYKEATDLLEGTDAYKKPLSSWDAIDRKMLDRAAKYEQMSDNAVKMAKDYKAITTISGTIGKVGGTLALGGAAYLWKAGWNEWMNQEKVGEGFAPRMAGYGQTSAQGVASYNRLRTSLGDKAVKYGYAGHEGLKAADIYSRISDGKIGGDLIEPMMRLSRAYGMDLSQTAQQFGQAGRTGALMNTPPKAFADMLATAIEGSHMAPRAEEFTTALTDAITAAGTRLPNVDATGIVSTMGKINRAGEVSGGVGMRGMGALPVMEGLGRVSDTTSAARLAFMSEVTRGQTGKQGLDLLWETQKRSEAKFGSMGGRELISGSFAALGNGKDLYSKHAIKSMTGLPNQVIDDLAKANFWEDLQAGIITPEQYDVATKTGMYTRIGVADAQTTAKLSGAKNRISQGMEPMIGGGMRPVGSAADVLSHAGKNLLRGEAIVGGLGLLSTAAKGARAVQAAAGGGEALGWGTAGSAAGTGAKLIGRLALPVAIASTIIDVAEQVFDPTRTAGEKWMGSIPLVGGYYSDKWQKEREAKGDFVQDRSESRIAQMADALSHTDAASKLFKADPELSRLTGTKEYHAALEREYAEKKLHIGTINITANSKSDAEAISKKLKQTLTEMTLAGGVTPAAQSVSTHGGK